MELIHFIHFLNFRLECPHFVLSSWTRFLQIIPAPCTLTICSREWRIAMSASLMQNTTGSCRQGLLKPWEMLGLFVLLHRIDQAQHVGCHAGRGITQDCLGATTREASGVGPFSRQAATTCFACESTFILSVSHIVHIFAADPTVWRCYCMIANDMSVV